MHERKARSRKRLPAKRSQPLAQRVRGAGRYREPTAVDRVADQRMAAPGEMHTNLVGPAGLEANADVRMRAETLNDPVVGDRRLTVFVHRHAHPVDAVPPNRRIDDASARQDANANGFVVAFDLARSEHAHQRCMCLQGSGDQQQSARFFVQAMHDARSRERRQLWIAVEQSVQKRAARIAGAGMDDETDRLVHHDKRRVLVHH